MSIKPKKKTKKRQNIVKDSPKITIKPIKKVVNSENKHVEAPISSNKNTMDAGGKEIKVVINPSKKPAASSEQSAKVTLDSKKNIVDLIKAKLDEEEEEIVDIIEEDFENSLIEKVAENNFDSVANTYTQQINMNVDLNAKLVDSIKESRKLYPEIILELIRENFEVSHKLALDNTAEMIDLYNKHSSRVVYFNQKFGERINSQIELLFKIK